MRTAIRKWLKSTYQTLSRKHTANIRCQRTSLELEGLEVRVNPDSGGGANIYTASVDNFQYYGGALISSVSVALIFLKDENTQSVLPVDTTLHPPPSPPSQDLFDSFLSTITSDGYISQQLSQYDQGSYIINNGSVYSNGSGVINDIVQIPSTKVSNYYEIQDSAIQSAIGSAIGNGTESNSANTLYFVFAPPGDAVVLGNDTSIYTTGSQNSFASYHSAYYNIATQTDVRYVVIPDAGAPNNNSLSGLSQFQFETMISSHELAESITDPAPNLPVGSGNDTGWINSNSAVVSANGNEATEIADQAVAEGYTLDGYMVQNLWSDNLVGAGTATDSGANNLYINQLTPPAAPPASGTTSVPVATFTTNNTSLTTSSFTAVVSDSATNSDWANVSISGGDGFFVVSADPPSQLDPSPPSPPVSVGSATAFNAGGMRVLVYESTEGSGAPVATRYQPFTVAYNAPLTYYADPNGGFFHSLTLEVLTANQVSNYLIYDNITGQPGLGDLVFTQAVNATTSNNSAIGISYGATSDLTINYIGGIITSNIAYTGNAGLLFYNLPDSVTVNNGSIVISSTPNVTVTFNPSITSLGINGLGSSYDTSAILENYPTAISTPVTVGSVEDLTVYNYGSQATLSVSNGIGTITAASFGTVTFSSSSTNYLPLLGLGGNGTSQASLVIPDPLLYTQVYVNSSFTGGLTVENLTNPQIPVPPPPPPPPPGSPPPPMYWQIENSSDAIINYSVSLTTVILYGSGSGSLVIGTPESNVSSEPLWTTVITAHNFGNLVAYNLPTVWVNAGSVDYPTSNGGNNGPPLFYFDNTSYFDSYTGQYTPALASLGLGGLGSGHGGTIIIAGPLANTQVNMTSSVQALLTYNLPNGTSLNHTSSTTTGDGLISIPNHASITFYDTSLPTLSLNGNGTNNNVFTINTNENITTVYIAADSSGDTLYVPDSAGVDITNTDGNGTVTYSYYKSIIFYNFPTVSDPPP